MEVQKKQPKIAEPDNGILDWIGENKIRNEKGDIIEFDMHPFLVDIYDDQSQNLTVMKGAQIGMSTLQILKNHRDAKRYKMDIIYTLPTDKDVSVFVGGKVNRIIANNPVMLEDVADKDSIEQKQVGNSMVYFRGTWTKKAAIMVTGDRLVHDEKDSSKLDIISDYQARLQHSKFKQTHTFSHPSLPETGVHADWMMSDQKHWHVMCRACGYEQFLNWDTEQPRKMSVDIERRAFVCKRCKGILTDRDRACGRWIARYPNRKWSGYWVSLLMCPWVSAGDIVDKFQHKDTTAEFFYTKILGLPYADASAKLLRDSFFQNLTGKAYAPMPDERIVIGIDTGLRIDYVMGDKMGLFFHGDCDDYNELDAIMLRWPKAIAVIDQGGDLIGSRKFYQRWKGRVILCALSGDRKTKELVKWGKGNEEGTAVADRNRSIQLVVDEFRTRRIPVHGTEGDWFEYWSDWNNLAKMRVLDPDTNATKGYKWVRSGRDHRALATVFWRIGMMRYSTAGAVIMPPTAMHSPNSYMVEPNQTVNFNPKEMFDQQELAAEDDWRRVG